MTIKFASGAALESSVLMAARAHAHSYMQRASAGARTGEDSAMIAGKLITAIAHAIGVGREVSPTDVDMMAKAIEENGPWR